MFGHQNDDDDKKQDEDIKSQPTATDSDAVSSPAEATSSPADSVPSSVNDPVSTDSDAPAPPDDTTLPTIAADDQAWQHPGTPIDGTQSINGVVSPAGGFPKHPSFTPATTPSPDSSDPVDSDEPITHELIEIKQQALTELSPLIDELDQTPEERFRTLMMMIQASDNEQLVKDAYTAAHSIEDEKVRAQALLDIVNEINYFTQQPPIEDQPAS
jgi:hypothetical protein